jgi:cytosine/uracil/thiamine/allantoin permease
MPLRNSYVLVHAVFYFVSVVIGTKAKLNLIFKKVCEQAKRFYGIAAFFQYAVADGIHRLLFASRTGPQEPPARPFTGQLAFDFLNPLL